MNKKDNWTLLKEELIKRNFSESDTIRIYQAISEVANQKNVSRLII